MPQALAYRWSIDGDRIAVNLSEDPVFIVGNGIEPEELYKKIESALFSGMPVKISILHTDGEFLNGFVKNNRPYRIKGTLGISGSSVIDMDLEASSIGSFTFPLNRESLVTLILPKPSGKRLHRHTRCSADGLSC